MTKKRLIVDDDYNWVDTVTDTVIEVEDAFDLVNELHEENKILKNKIGTYHSANELLKETIDRLRSDG